MSKTDPALVEASGIGVQPTYGADGRVIFAEVEPAGSRWLPWFGRTSRWWYEVHAVGEADEHGVTHSTFAYLEGGSGGGFTFASCVRRAQTAVQAFAFEELRVAT